MSEEQIRYLHRLKILTTVLPGTYLYSMLDEAAERLRERAAIKLNRRPELEQLEEPELEHDEEKENTESQLGEGQELLSSVRDRPQYPRTQSLLLGHSRRSGKRG
jgi:hypothetical protein